MERLAVRTASACRDIRNPNVAFRSTANESNIGETVKSKEKKE